MKKQWFEQKNVWKGSNLHKKSETFPFLIFFEKAKFRQENYFMRKTTTIDEFYGNFEKELRNQIILA